jgi:hypothetical protein
MQNKLEEEESLVNRTKKYAEAIKNIFPQMPNDSAELPSYLHSVDNLFDLYDVPNDLRSKLLLPHLTGKCKSVIAKLSTTQLNDYDSIKYCLLKEFQITGRELRSRFVNASKRNDESYANFRSRLELMLLQYIQSRSITSLEKLTDLLVADRLKDSLTTDILRYVLGLEGDECHSSSKIAANADIYCCNYNEDGSYKASTVTNLSMHENKFPYRGKFGKFKPFGQRGAGTFAPRKDNFVSNSSVESTDTIVKSVEVNATNVFNTTSRRGKGFAGKSLQRLCFCCNSDKHTVSHCPH